MFVLLLLLLDSLDNSSDMARRQQAKRKKGEPPRILETASDLAVRDFNKIMLAEVYREQYKSHEKKEPAPHVIPVERPLVPLDSLLKDEMGLDEICSAFVEMACHDEGGTPAEIYHLSSRLEKVCMKKARERQLSPDEQIIHELYEVERKVAKEDRMNWEAHIKKTLHPNEWGFGTLPYLMECAYRDDVDDLIECTKDCDYYGMRVGQEPRDCVCSSEGLRLKQGFHTALSVAIDMEHFELIKELYIAAEDDYHLRFVLDKWNCRFNQWRRLPASEALFRGHTKIAHLLLKHSGVALLESRHTTLEVDSGEYIDVHFPNQAERISVWADVCMHNGDELLKLVHEHHRLTNVDRNDRCHLKVAVRDAACSGNVEALEYLDRKGFIKSWEDMLCDTSGLTPAQGARPYMSPLHYALMNSHVEMVKFILAKCPETIYIRDCLNLEHIEKALLWNEEECFRMIYDLVAELPPLNRLLDLALQYRNVKLCDLLLPQISHNLYELEPLTIAMGCRLWRVAEQILYLYLSNGGMTNAAQARDMNNALNTALRVFGLDDSPNAKLSAVVMLTTAGASLPHARYVKEKDRHGPIVKEILRLKVPSKKARWLSMRALFKFLEDQSALERQNAIQDENTNFSMYYNPVWFMPK